MLHFRLQFLLTVIHQVTCQLAAFFKPGATLSGLLSGGDAFVPFRSMSELAFTHTHWVMRLCPFDLYVWVRTHWQTFQTHCADFNSDQYLVPISCNVWINGIFRKGKNWPFADGCNFLPIVNAALGAANSRGNWSSQLESSFPEVLKSKGTESCPGKV